MYYPLCIVCPSTWTWLWAHFHTTGAEPVSKPASSKHCWPEDATNCAKTGLILIALFVLVLHPYTKMLIKKHSITTISVDSSVYQTNECAKVLMSCLFLFLSTDCTCAASRCSVEYGTHWYVLNFWLLVYVCVCHWLTCPSMLRTDVFCLGLLMYLNSLNRFSECWWRCFWNVSFISLFLRAV